ncbi:MAG: M20/M25/M40 family metallo-hydrolase [Halioglobus sp.]|nr:M20/M25/M40 family metallo-hydrolase [Halioglobus sp.]
MKHLIPALLMVCLCTVARAASPTVTVTPDMALGAGTLMQHALDGNIAYELVASLTTEVGPRLAGTEAEARARHWAVEKLTALGFSNVRVEAFEVPRWERGEERARIVAPFPQPLVVTALGGSTSTGPGGVRGEVVSFGSLAALEAAPAAKVQGRIVFIDEPMARSRDGSGYVEAVGKRRQAAYVAARKGAIAALIRSVGTSVHRFAHAGQMRRVTEADESGVPASGVPASGVPAAGVPAAALASPDANQLRRILDRGEPVILELVLTPRELPPAPSGNVIAEIPGREVPDEIVLVGAHLDSWDLGTGAVDDGAGVGIVVAAAKVLLDQLPQPPRRTIRIVLFGAEEVGLVGARAYAERHAATLANHALATESDFGAGNIWRFDTGVPEERRDAAAALGDVLEPLGVAPGDNEAHGGPDMKYLREAGVPVVGLLQDGRDYFDLHHTADDTLNKIAPGDLDQNVAAYAAFLYLAAETAAYFR